MSVNKPKQKEKTETKLTIKQQLFIDYYLQTFNATKAAKLAGYSDETAKEIGCENLTKPNIKLEIDRRVEETRKRIPTDFIEHLKNQAFFNIADLLDDNGNINKQKLKDNNIPGIVSGITIQTDSIKIDDQKEAVREKVSFKLTDQSKAIEMLSKLLKLTDDSVKVNNFILTNVSDDAMKM